MNIHLNQTGPYAGLVRHILLEGDTVDRGQADVIIPDPVQLPDYVLGITNKSPCTHFVTRWFDGQKFLDQTFVGLPLHTLLNNNLGPACSSGLAGRFVPTEVFSHYFDDPTLVKILETMNYVGLTSISFSETSITGLQTGMPHFGIYVLLEAARSKIGDWFRCPSRLHESWIAGVLVSRFPYPIVQDTSAVSVDGLTREVEQHVWVFDGEEFRSTVSVKGQIVGMVTAASPDGKLSSACRMCSLTCQGLSVPDMVYRTDLNEEIKGRWNELKEKGIVP